MKKTGIALLGATVMIVIVCVVASIFAVKIAEKGDRAGSSSINIPQFVTASSSLLTLSTSTAQIVLATSTQRMAATLQTVNCGANGAVWARALNGTAATSTAGGFLIPSATTLAFGSFPSANPVPTGAVSAIASTSICSLLVTEFRTSGY